MADKVKKGVSDFGDGGFVPSPRSALGGRAAPRVQKHFYKPSKTRASEMASTDLKTLVHRWRLAGSPPPTQRQFADISELPKSKLEALMKIDAAMEAFQALPLKVRQAIGHDPRRLEDWIISNPELALDAGLFEKAPQSSPANPTSSADAEEGKKGGAASAAPSSSGGQSAPT